MNLKYRFNTLSNPTTYPPPPLVSSSALCSISYTGLRSRPGCQDVLIRDLSFSNVTQPLSLRGLPLTPGSGPCENASLRWEVGVPSIPRAKACPCSAGV